MPETMTGRGPLRKSVKVSAHYERIAIRHGQAVMDAEVANSSASKHGPGQSVKFLAAREHIDNQLYALDLCL